VLVPPEADANHVFSAAALNFTIFDWGLVIDRVRKVGDLCVAACVITHDSWP